MFICTQGIKASAQKKSTASTCKNQTSLKSQIKLGWKRPLEVIWSNLLLPKHIQLNQGFVQAVCPSEPLRPANIACYCCWLWMLGSLTRHEARINGWGCYSPTAKAPWATQTKTYMSSSERLFYIFFYLSQGMFHNFYLVLAEHLRFRPGTLNSAPAIIWAISGSNKSPKNTAWCINSWARFIF